MMHLGTLGVLSGLQMTYEDQRMRLNGCKKSLSSIA